MKRTIAIAAIAAFSFLPLLASAQSLPNVWSPSTIAGPLTTCTGVIATNVSTSGSVGLQQGTCWNLCQLIFNVEWDIYVAIAWVIWIILPISVISGGIMYMLGGANPGLLETAKKTLWGAVIGAAIVLFAYLFISTLVGFLKVTGLGGFSSGAISCPAAPTS